MSQKEWREFTKSEKFPPDIPANPARSYKHKGWAGMGDWLGTGTVAPRLREFRPFNPARERARSLELKSWTEWKAFCKSGNLPQDIPAKPDWVYRDEGWAGIRDWLGTEQPAGRKKRMS
jgi:hypothetical protein